MAPKLRKALGAVKDQSSIVLAKVSGSAAPRLHVAIIKATSHSNKPASERQVIEILEMSSHSTDAVSACIDILSRRLARTRDWVVALKALTLVHRLLADGDPAFQDEILFAKRKGARHLLSLSDFYDTAHSDSWDHSAFIRAYAFYLVHNLEHIAVQGKRGGGSRRFFNEFAAGRGWFTQPNRMPPSPACSASPRKSEVLRQCEEQDYGKPPKAPREMKVERLLERLYELQRLLNRFFACRPTGNAGRCRMILAALHPIVRESFQIYADICEVLDVLLDRFFEMEYPDCVKSFDAYASAARQMDELIAFYAWCKNMGVARTSDYPEVRRITKKLLETLRDHTSEKARRPSSPPSEEILEDSDEEADQDTVEVKAHPALYSNNEEGEPEPAKALTTVEPVKRQQEEGNLVDLSDDADALDLLLGTNLAPSGGVTSAWQNPAAEIGKDNWEIALVEAKSNLSNHQVTLGGGFDELLLNSMYDHGGVRQQLNAQANRGSASSVVAEGQGGASVLSLPASGQMIEQDPFAASLGIAPPSYVQMADVENKQRLLAQEQAFWQQYAYGGMQAQSSLMTHSNPFLPKHMMAYGMPVAYNTVGGYYYQTY